MKGRLFTRPKTEGALNKRFCRHAGIYRSDVSFLLINLGQSTASRSGPGQAIGRAGSNHALPIVHDEFRPAIPQRGARQHGPSPLHRHPQLKSIAASKGIIYHRTVTSLLTVCLSPGGRFNLQLNRKSQQSNNSSLWKSTKRLSLFVSGILTSIHMTPKSQSWQTRFFPARQSPCTATSRAFI